MASALPVLAAFVTLSVVSVAGFGLLGVALARTSSPVRWFRRLYLFGLLPLGLLAYGLFAVLSAGSLARDALAGVAPDVAASVAGDLLASAVTVALAATVVLLGYLASLPSLRRARDLDYGTGRAAVAMGRYLLTLVLVLAPFFTVLKSRSGFAVVAFAVVAIVAFYLASGWVLAVSNEVRRPDEEEAARLDAAMAEAGLDVRDVRVLVTDGSEQAVALVRGPPGRKRLFVSDFLLANLDDEALVAVLATRAAQTERHYLLARMGALVVLVVGAGLAISFPGPVGVALLLGGLVATLLTLWYAARLVYRADADAADRVGAGTLAATIEELCALAGVEPSSGRVAGILRGKPGMGARLSRLRDRADQ